MENFEYSDLLGQGQFGKVYRGRNKSTGETVAVKVMDVSRRILNRRGETLEEAEREMMSRLRHDNIVRLFHTEEINQEFFMVLEYCGGGDLEERREREADKRISESLAQKYMWQLAQGLFYIWSKNLMHRDLKPPNLLLTSRDDETAVLKIADFGMARHLDQDQMAMTICGSPLYMAPEILFKQPYNSKCDLWSVGAILFELVTSEPPFNGTDLNNFKANLRRKDWKIPDGVNLSPACIKLLKALLVKDPNERCSIQAYFDAEFFHPEGTPETQNRLDASTLPEQFQELSVITEESKLSSVSEEDSKMPPTPPSRFKHTVSIKRPDGSLGLSIRLEKSTGLLTVKDMKETIPPEVKHALKVGDQLVKINGTSVFSAKDFMAALEVIPAGEDMAFELLRRAPQEGSMENPDARANSMTLYETATQENKDELKALQEENQQLTEENEKLNSDLLQALHHEQELQRENKRLQQENERLRGLSSSNQDLESVVQACTFQIGDIACFEPYHGDKSVYVGKHSGAHRFRFLSDRSLMEARNAHNGTPPDLIIGRITQTNGPHVGSQAPQNYKMPMWDVYHVIDLDNASRSQQS